MFGGGPFGSNEYGSRPQRRVVSQIIGTILKLYRWTFGISDEDKNFNVKNRNQQATVLLAERTAILKIPLRSFVTMAVGVSGSVTRYVRAFTILLNDRSFIVKNGSQSQTIAFPDRSFTIKTFSNSFILVS